MSQHKARRLIVAGVTALALLGVSAGAAAAAETTSDNFGGTVYLSDQDTYDIAQDATLSWTTPVFGQIAVGDYGSTRFPVPAADAHGQFAFIATPGQENDVNNWLAFASLGSVNPGGILQPKLTPVSLNLGTLGSAGVAAAGGDYSLGFAYTTANPGAVTTDGLYFIHIHVNSGTPSTATYTWETVSEAVAPVATPTVVATSALADTDFNLSATLDHADATGTIEFFADGDSLGTGNVSVVGGVAKATIAVDGGLPAGSYAVTAVYSGDGTYDGNTSAPVTVVVSAPQATEISSLVTNGASHAGELVRVTATVTTAGGDVPTGSVTFVATKTSPAATVTIGSGAINPADGTAYVETNGLGAGAWTITATYAGDGVFVAADPATVALTLEANANAAEDWVSNVYTTIEQGSLTITTPWTVEHPLNLGTLVLNQDDSTFELDNPVMFASGEGETVDGKAGIAGGIKVENQRSDNPGFTVQVQSSDFVDAAAGTSFLASYASLNLHAVQVEDNALQADAVSVTAPFVLPSTAANLATYAGGVGGHVLGTAWLAGTIDIKGVPSSTPSGTYGALITFSAF